MKQYTFFSALLCLFLIFSQIACAGLQPISKQNEPGSNGNRGDADPEYVFEEEEEEKNKPEEKPEERPQEKPEEKVYLSTRDAVVKYAKEQLGSDYKYGGRSPKGFDCSGFTYFVFGAFEVELTPVSRVQETEGAMIPVADAQPGDLVFFRRSKNGDVFHVGLVVSNGPEGIVVIHSTTSRGVVIDNISQSSYWSAKYMTARDVLSE
ncbi:MAG: C40 family peptidase [Phaeodactylibacter sp.]|nr:C40 family peptidase [Phaeodactylibacter sp.]